MMNRWEALGNSAFFVSTYNKKNRKEVKKWERLWKRNGNDC